MGVGVGTAEKLVSEGGIEYRQQWGGDVCSVPIHGVDRIDPALFASRNEALRSGLDAAEARCREQVGGHESPPLGVPEDRVPFLGTFRSFDPVARSRRRAKGKKPKPSKR